MRFFKRDKNIKSNYEVSEKFDKNKIYNCDKQLITNIFFCKVPQDGSMNVDQMTEIVINFLSKFLNKKLNNFDENNKIKNFINEYIKNLSNVEHPKNIGLIQVNLNNGSNFEFSEIEISSKNSKHENCNFDNDKSNNQNFKEK